MIKTLYPCFQHWSEKGSVWIISDTHFDDCDREYMGYNISEEEQINILKKYCHKNDTLIHLGDVGNAKYLKELKCYKVLIMGNHDQSIEKFKEKTEMIDLDNYSQEEIKELQKRKEIDFVNYEFHKPFVRGYKSNGLFNEVYSGPLWISKKLILSHEPISIEDNEWGNPIAFNIHGHDHSGCESKNHLNICQNIYGYIPLNLNQFIKNGYLNKIKDVHTLTKEYATARKEANKQWSSILNV